MKSFKRFLVCAALLLFAGPALAIGNPTFVTKSLTTTGTVGPLSVYISNLATVLVQASGTGAGLTFTGQCSVDGSIWQTEQGISLGTGTAAASFSANGAWVFPVAGCSQFRVNLSAISGGTETFYLNGALPVTFFLGSGGSSGAVTQGAGNIANPWYVNELIGGAAISVGNPTFAQITNVTPLGRFLASGSNPVVVSAWPTPYSEIVPNNTTAVVVKASAGTLGGLYYGNIGSVPLWVKLYDAASGTTCGQASPAPIARIMIPVAGTAANGAGNNIPLGNGLRFQNGITMCVTAALSDTDTTAPTANVATVTAAFE